MKVKALGIPNIIITELNRVPNKDEVFDLTEDRAISLSTKDNSLGYPVVEIVKEEVKVAKKAKKK